jgi:hypothetical protein
MGWDGGLRYIDPRCVLRAARTGHAMASVRQYFETDFNHAARVHLKFAIPEDSDIEGALFIDFLGYMAFLSCYVPGEKRPLEFYLRLVRTLDYGKTQLILQGKITLPSARQFHGELRIANKNPFEILARFFCGPSWISMNDVQSSRRVFIYSETQLGDEEIVKLKEEGSRLGNEVQFRSQTHAMARSTFEKPLAFICHDSREKDIARKIAISLQRMMCPVWYDEFSLKVGDNLRESIETGLRNCKKCVLVLSPNFFSNNGWTKKEFDSVFTREILEERRLALPVWHGVSKQQVYDYSSSLLDVKGLDWNQLGEDEVCRQLCRAIEP